MKASSHLTINTNKRGYFDYEILDELEVGIVLYGKEIKSIRDKKVDLQGSYARILGGQKPELYWVGGHIAGDDPERSRKLLLHKKELQTLIGKSQQKGLTLIPLSLYLKRGRAKLLIGLGKGKKLHDKRDVIKKRDLNREQRREFSNR